MAGGVAHRGGGLLPSRDALEGRLQAAQIRGIEGRAREGVVRPAAQVREVQLGHRCGGLLHERTRPLLDRPPGALECGPERFADVQELAVVTLELSDEFVIASQRRMVRLESIGLVNQ